MRQPTRQFTPSSLHRGPGRHDADDVADFPHELDEYPSSARQFAGINIEEFAWARQRARRAMAFWVLAVLILTGLVAAGAWTVGTHLDALIGR